MGIVRGVCAVLAYSHSVTFRQNPKVVLETLVIENCCKGGSKCSGILNFQKFEL